MSDDDDHMYINIYINICIIELLRIKFPTVGSCCVWILKLNFSYLRTWFVIWFWVFRSSVPRLFFVMFFICDLFSVLIITSMVPCVSSFGACFSEFGNWGGSLHMHPFLEKAFFRFRWLGYIWFVKKFGKGANWSAYLAIVLSCESNSRTRNLQIRYIDCNHWGRYTVSPFNIICYHVEIFQKQDFSA